MLSKCKCPNKVRCKQEFGYHTLNNPTIVPLTQRAYMLQQAAVKRHVERHALEKLYCVGCNKDKKIDKFCYITFDKSTKEIEICNLCYKVFEPIWIEIKKLGVL